MEATRGSDSAGQVPERHLLVPTLATAGVAGPILFTVLVILQTLLNPDYNSVALPISALAAWPTGWLQNLNFFVFGFLMMAYAIGLHLGISQARVGWIGPALLVLSGVGLLLAGSFPWRYASEGGAPGPVVTVSGATFIVSAGHIVAGVLAFFGAGSGLVATSRRMAGDPTWRSLGNYVLMTGIAMIVLFIASLVSRSPEAALAALMGVLQRVTVALWFVCTIVLALRLRRVAADTLRGDRAA